MRLYVRTDLFTTVILTSLGLAPLTGCGGKSTLNAYEAPDGAFLCANPTPVGAGLVRCESGLVHRAAKVECPSPLPRSTRVTPDAGVGTCQSDADCVARPHGYCNPSSMGGAGQLTEPFCNYGCVRDEECEVGQICVCGDPVGTCAFASCSSDADCGAADLTCGKFGIAPGCHFIGFACQTPQDTCVSDADCKAYEECGIGVPVERTSRGDSIKGIRSCQAASCQVGRPFLIDGHERLASRTRDADWQADDIAPNAAHLSSGARARLAEAWTAVALMEHASIAAFARFTLQLLALGAPADLIERSNAALADETLHARMAFRIASAHGGRPVGPGNLDVRGALDDTSFETILVNVIREGCVGETVAAIEAAAAYECATDGAVRQALARIAQDEARHAELAWCFVKWALSRGGDAFRLIAAKAFDAERKRLLDVAEVSKEMSLEDEQMLAGGIVPENLRPALRAEAMDRVVRVCADALLGNHSLAA